MNVHHFLAYIDPMSGAVLLQLIFALVAGTAAFFRHTIFGGIKRMFGRQQNRSAN